MLGSSVHLIVVQICVGRRDCPLGGLGIHQLDGLVDGSLDGARYQKGYSKPEEVLTYINHRGRLGRCIGSVARVGGFCSSVFGHCATHLVWNTRRTLC